MPHLADRFRISADSDRAPRTAGRRPAARTCTQHALRRRSPASRTIGGSAIDGPFGHDHQMSYAIKNLRDVKDVAPDAGFSEVQEARFAYGDLGAEDTGLAFHVVKPGKRQAFAHRH